MAEVRRTKMAEALLLRTAIALRHGWDWAEASYMKRDVELMSDDDDAR
jgi:hypothetical protein